MTAMTEERKAAMRAGRERAKQERAKQGNGAKKPRKVKQPPTWKFNIDDSGDLAIIDERGHGIELNAADTRRLALFLARCTTEPSA